MGPTNWDLVIATGIALENRFPNEKDFFLSRDHSSVNNTTILLIITTPLYECINN